MGNVAVQMRASSRSRRTSVHHVHGHQHLCTTHQPIHHTMWPFGSGDKDASDLAKELPPNLQDFFGNADPATKRAASGETLKDEKVAQVLARQPQAYSHQFDAYKRDELLKKAVAVNCAEIQHAVVTCYQGWLLTSANHCTDEIRRATRCTEVQQRALQRLRYADCYSERQCQYMRAMVDRLFTENFGQYGETKNDEAERAFSEGIDAVFERAWR